MKSLFKKFNLDGVERIEAVDGNKISKNNLTNIITEKGLRDAANKNQKVYTYLTNGGIGCALSHKKIWEKIVDNNIQTALILEDDIKFINNFIDRYKILEKYFPENYDIIFLGYHPSTYRFINQCFNKFLIKSDKVYGLFGYVLSNKGAKKLLANLFPISMQLDSAISDSMNSFDIYLIKPTERIIFSTPSEINDEWGTDIQTRIEGYQNLFKQNNFSKILGIIFISIILIFFLIFIFTSECSCQPKNS